MISAVILPATNAIHQVTALVAWGGAAVVMCLAFKRDSISLAAGLPILLAVLLVTTSIAGSVWWAKLPLSLAMMGWGALLAASLLFVIGLGARQQGYAKPLLTVLAAGWVVLGVLTTGVCFIQVFAPYLADGDWIARTSLPGRAIGNMRQPNHTAVLLCWSCISVLWLGENAMLSKRLTTTLFAIFISATVLTASRTGMVAISLLAFWGIDRKLSTATRRLLLCAPLFLVGIWVLSDVWASWSAQSLGATQRLVEGIGSPARMVIWADAVDLALRHPWTGVGWGGFNLAWTLTDFARRSPAAFDHVHNLPLQLVVELGLPIGTVVLLTLVWAISRAYRSVRSANKDDSVALRFVAMILATTALHSMLEFPLWYMYFLLPTALLLGLCFGHETKITQPRATTVQVRTMTYASAWVMAAGVAMYVDYRRVAPLYAPDQLPLPMQIERGQESWLFGTWADYLYAVHIPSTKSGLAAAHRAAHLILDTPLLIAWAESLHSAGDVDRAAFLAQRVRDFHDPAARKWLDKCRVDRAGENGAPFQCVAPTRHFNYSDFL